MKVLWLGQQDHNLLWLNDLRHILGNLCEVVAYGDGEEFIPKFNVRKIAETEKPDVIMIGSNQYKFINLNKVKIPKALKCADPWANIWKHIEFIKRNNVDLVLMNYKCCTPEYKKYLPEKKFGWLPHAVNAELFKNLHLERPIDVMCAGAGMPSHYPLRHFIFNSLPKMKELNIFTSRGHRLSFEDYVKTINQSKIFAFGNVNHVVGHSETLVFAMAKIYEIMACETLCMMDKPDMAEELHFVPDYNFVEINEENFAAKLKYYIEQPELREKIAKAGYETVMKYHTIEIRGKELMEQLKEMIE